jgi:GNAT superfamily N-acetyltransferase
MTYKYAKPTFIALYDNNRLIGVNSGHPTGKSYRSRGLYVFNEYRGNGYGTVLLLETIKVAKELGSTSIWSMPRQTSMKSYASAGFELTTERFPTETSDCNAYASLNFDK